MRDILEQEESIISEVNLVMQNLRGLALVVQLRKLSHFGDKERNVTWRSSTFSTIAPCVDLMDHLLYLESG